MKQFFLASVALAALFAAPAMAADLPARPAPAYKAPPPVVVTYRWSGCYVGGHGGGLWVDKDWTDLTVPGVATAVGGHSASGWLAGVQAGCDVQFGGWVLGIGGDYAWTDAEGSHASAVFGETYRTSVDSLASVTGRIGYAFDRFLGYVKGGAAWERDNYDYFTTAVPGVILGSAGHTRSGWTVGVGGEFAFTNNISGFVEYNYYDFGTRSVTFSDASVWDIDERKSVIKAGLNFRFGFGPVVANY